MKLLDWLERELKTHPEDTFAIFMAFWRVLFSRHGLGAVFRYKREIEKVVARRTGIWYPKDSA